MSVVDDLGNNCTRRVRLHFKSIGTPVVPELTALTNMQRIYGPNGVAVEYASGECLALSDFQSIVLSNVNAGTCLIADAGTLTGDQNMLFKLGSRQGVRSTDIVVYYVNQLTQSNGGSLAGCSSHPTKKPCVAVASGGSAWTLAHEVGHVLGLVHVSDKTNMMNTPTSSITSNPPNITATQLTTVLSSPWVVAA